jgi:tRNA(Ile)-lysidine synthetase-like protein
MRPRGLDGTKKLQDIFIDCKVPADRRAEVPIIVETLPSKSPLLPTAEDAAQACKLINLSTAEAAARATGRILGILGVQGSEASLPTTFREGQTEIIGPCLLIVALSPTTTA